MTNDTVLIESNLARVVGALRGLSGLLHAAGDNNELWKPDDLGYLVACLADEAERTSREAAEAMGHLPITRGT